MHLIKELKKKWGLGIHNIAGILLTDVTMMDKSAVVYSLKTVHSVCI